MADYVQLMWPALIGWLGDSARIAVQVFLVIGGFWPPSRCRRTVCPAWPERPRHARPLRAVMPSWRHRLSPPPCWPLAGCCTTPSPRPPPPAAGGPFLAVAWRARLRIAVGRRLVCGHRLPDVCAGAVDGGPPCRHAATGVAGAARIWGGAVAAVFQSRCRLG